jgi:hypothetical protein
MEMTKVQQSNPDSVDNLKELIEKAQEYGVA